MKQLREGAIYCLGLTPYQYVARRLADDSKYRTTEGIDWVLHPENADNALIGGPVLFVMVDGNIGRKGGITELTTDDLQFTGRYKQ